MCLKMKLCPDRALRKIAKKENSTCLNWLKSKFTLTEKAHMNGNLFLLELVVKYVSKPLLLSISLNLNETCLKFTKSLTVILHFDQ